MKKLLCMLLSIAMLLSLCVGAMAEEGSYKIAILTGTTSQG